MPKHKGNRAQRCPPKRCKLEILANRDVRQSLKKRMKNKKITNPIMYFFEIPVGATIRLRLYLPIVTYHNKICLVP